MILSNMAWRFRARRLRLLQIDSNEKAGAAVRGYGRFCFVVYKYKEKIPSSQAKDGLTYDGISREIDNSSAFSIIYMLAKVKIIIWMKIQLGLEQIMIDIILEYVLCCSLKSGEMVNFKGRIKIFSDEIFMGKEFFDRQKRNVRSHIFCRR